MRFTERRSCKRIPVLIDVLLVNRLGKYPAEVCDISTDGIGLVMQMTHSDLSNGDNVIIEFDDAAYFESSLSGKLMLGVSATSYRPNVRTAGLSVDVKGRGSLASMIRDCDGALLHPSAEAGFNRAWNTLNAIERRRIQEFFETLRATDAEGSQVVENLISDPNSSATRLLHLMQVLLDELRLDPDGPAFSLLKKAFTVYTLEYSIKDTPKDRLIRYELGSSRLASVQT